MDASIAFAAVLGTMLSSTTKTLYACRFEVGLEMAAA